MDDFITYLFILCSGAAVSDNRSDRDCARVLGWHFVYVTVNVPGVHNAVDFDVE